MTRTSELYLQNMETWKWTNATNDLNMKSPNLKYNKAIVSLKLRKAPGVDTVQAEHLNLSTVKIKSLYILADYQRASLKLGSSQMNGKGISLPTYKGDNKIKNSPDSYRPVSLLSCLLKAFEEILHNRISDVIISEIKFPSPQHQGFQKDHWCKF